MSFTTHYCGQKNIILNSIMKQNRCYRKEAESEIKFATTVSFKVKPSWAQNYLVYYHLCRINN